MARPREFNEIRVLESAMHCFWGKGYETTSVRDLAREMGITGASLYNAFGDKRSLYIASLKHYLEVSVQDRIQRMSKLPPYEALAGFFQEIVERSVSDENHRGCMLVNAGLETAPHDEDIRRLVAEEFRMIETFFRRCVVAGREAGTMRRDLDPDEAGKTLLAVLLGVRVLARTRPQREILEGAAQGFLLSLRAQP